MRCADAACRGDPQLFAGAVIFSVTPAIAMRCNLLTNVRARLYSRAFRGRTVPGKTISVFFRYAERVSDSSGSRARKEPPRILVRIGLGLVRISLAEATAYMGPLLHEQRVPYSRTCLLRTFPWKTGPSYERIVVDRERVRDEEGTCAATFSLLNLGMTARRNRKQDVVVPALEPAQTGKQSRGDGTFGAWPTASTPFSTRLVRLGAVAMAALA